jgi:hypothetical protein
LRANAGIAGSGAEAGVNEAVKGAGVCAGDGFGAVAVMGSDAYAAIGGVVVVTLAGACAGTGVGARIEAYVAAAAGAGVGTTEGAAGAAARGAATGTRTDEAGALAGAVGIAIGSVQCRGLKNDHRPDAQFEGRPAD